MQHNINNKWMDARRAGSADGGVLVLWVSLASRDETWCCAFHRHCNCATVESSDWGVLQWKPGQVVSNLSLPKKLPTSSLVLFRDGTAIT